MKKSFILALVLIVTLIFSVQAVQWNKYTCDKLPKDAGFKDGGISEVKIIDDPEITKNKILEFKSGEKGGQWKYSIEAAKAVTIVVRAKSIDMNTNSVDLDWRATNGRERVMIKPTMIDVNKAGKLIEMADDGKWHIWRITMTFANGKVTTTIYKDEDPKPIAENLVAESTDKSNTFRFGDGSSTDSFAAYYDWIVWTTGGALSPEKGKLPKMLKLTGLK